MNNDNPPSPINVEDNLWVLSETTGFSQYDFIFQDHFCCRHPYKIDDEISAVARLGAAPDYKERYESLLEWNIRLIHSPEEYNRTSNLPEWYPILEEYTPRSKWYETQPSASDILSSFKLPVFLKGERQTNKHSGSQSVIKSREQLEDVLIQWKKEPILWWQKVVCREYEELRPVAKTVGDCLQKSYEFRTFWWQMECVGVGKYWVTEDYELEGNDLDVIKQIGSDVAQRLGVIFLVIDFAQKVDGTWIVIEVNDGQDSGYAGVSPRFMWSRIVELQKR